MSTTPKQPKWQIAIIPLLLTVAILMYQILFLGGAPHIPLVLGIVITALVGMLHGYKWQDIQEGMVHGVAVSLPVLGIFLVVGMTIGTWILSGTVPLLTHAGLMILSPEYFLPISCIICSIVSIFTGTSWGTVGTIGLALLGIGESMGVPMHVTAGAIVSGAWFGDKMSPLSDTTNFTAAITGTNLYTHIRNMLPTTIPAMVIALLLFTYTGNNFTSDYASPNAANDLDDFLTQNFNLNLLVLLPPFVIGISIWRKVDPMPGIFLGVIAASLVAYFLQDASFGNIMAVMMNGYVSDTGFAYIDKLLTKGGIMSMAWVITLIMIAMAFGGALEKTGCLDSVLHAIMRLIKKRVALVFACMLSTVSLNFASNAFIAYTLPGRMFSPAFRGQGLSTCNTSRILEDGATMTAPLIPWNSGAVFVSSTLGIPTLMYAPFAFSNWIAPIIDLFWGLTGWFMPKASSEEIQKWIEAEDVLLIDGHLSTATKVNTEFLKNVNKQS